MHTWRRSSEKEGRPWEDMAERLDRPHCLHGRGPDGTPSGPALAWRPGRSSPRHHGVGGRQNAPPCVWPAVDADPRRPRPREHGARSPEEPSAPRENRRRDPPAIRRTDRPSLRQSGRLKGLSQGAEPRFPRCPVEFSVSEPDGQLAQRRRF